MFFAKYLTIVSQRAKGKVGCFIKLIRFTFLTIRNGKETAITLYSLKMPKFF